MNALLTWSVNEKFGLGCGLSHFQNFENCVLYGEAYLITILILIRLTDTKSKNMSNLKLQNEVFYLSPSTASSLSFLDSCNMNILNFQCFKYYNKR